MFAFGAASAMGDPGTGIAEPVTAIASTPTGDGYWLVARDGGVFTYGDATFLGSTGALRTERAGGGDGGHAVGDGLLVRRPRRGCLQLRRRHVLRLDRWDQVELTHRRHGRHPRRPGLLAGGRRRRHLHLRQRCVPRFDGGSALVAPVVGIAATPGGDGYWMAAADGGVFAFGAARHQMPSSDLSPAAAVTGIAATPSGQGYWLVAKDGSIYSFGDAPFKGSLGDDSPGAPVTDVASHPDGDGYWVATGENPPPPPAPRPAPRRTAPVSVRSTSSGSSVWDAIARCESGGNWSINTGNGYYGGIQFSLSSWRAVGGTGYPHQASRATQIAMGERLKAIQGWGAWPTCSRKLGLR